MCFRMSLTSVISHSPVQVGVGFDHPFNQFVASFANPFRSKNVRSIGYVKYAVLGRQQVFERPVFLANPALKSPSIMLPSFGALSGGEQHADLLYRARDEMKL